MAETDYYRILGITPSATSKQIKSAYRKLVKKHHPDLFATPAEKARATAQFHQINRAYAVLGDPKRRSYYDQIRSQETGNVKPGPAAAPREPSTHAKQTAGELVILLWRFVGKSLSQLRIRTSSAACLNPAAKRLTKFVRQLERRIPKGGFARLPLWQGALVLSCFAVISLLIVLWKEPKAATNWVLLENRVVEPLRPISPTFHEPNWSIVAYYNSRSHCDTALKERVSDDEQQGAKAFFDRLDGSTAITVRVKNEAALAEEYFQAKLQRSGTSAVDPQILRKQAEHEASEFIRKNGLAQQVRKVQCREVVLHTESWFKRMMKRAGLSS